MDIYDVPEFQQFMADNLGLGAIKVQMLFEGGALPMEGADVVLYKRLGNAAYRLADGKTDSSGIVEFADLPCLAAKYSLAPDLLPYAGVSYEVEISHPEYGHGLKDIAVFDGVQSIQQYCPLRDMHH